MNMSPTINMFSLCFYHIMFTLSIYGGMGHTDGIINSKMIGGDLCLAELYNTHNS
jgi:hypothetical protein